ncbi:NADP-dependent oxidoreductase [Agromyces humi]|uniref:NADP-dependent oxidoreductase n=1 Tax=Agromyces humi TaxID=1766800 RepID=UPI00135BC3CB|nr:NADP-dependent oxidoreductase [Agromyces humi]
MTAFVIDAYKEPMHEAEVPTPAVGDHDVLVRVQAAGVNQLDAGIRDGRFRQILPYRLPQILGNDLAGTVARVGAKVDRFAPGDRVYGRPDKDRIGTFAEELAVDQADLAAVPESITIEEAASLPLVALTAWQAFVEIADVRPGQTVLIHGGAGGVGSIAIQLAKHLGAIVATTASASNADYVRGLGADLVIDYRSQDFEHELHDVDVVLDSLGGETLEKSIRIVRPGGRVIGIAGPPDPGFARQLGAGVPLRLAMRALSSGVRRRARRRGVEYSFLFMRADGGQLQRITELVDAGIITPQVGRVFPFAETPEALAALERGGIRGKVVVSGKDRTRAA